MADPVFLLRNVIECYRKKEFRTVIQAWIVSPVEKDVRV
mgnify:FL=1